MHLLCQMKNKKKLNFFYFFFGMKFYEFIIVQLGVVGYHD